MAKQYQVDCGATTNIISNKIKFDQDPHEKALYVPMDSEGEYLFGRQVDKEGESVGFEDIAPDFASKLTALRDARAALKNPKAQTKCIRTTYWLAKEKLPISKYPSLYKLCKLQGVELDVLNIQGDDYSSRTSAEEFLNSIVHVIVTKIDSEIKKEEILFFRQEH